MGVYSFRIRRLMPAMGHDGKLANYLLNDRFPPPAAQTGSSPDGHLRTLTLAFPTSAGGEKRNDCFRVRTGPYQTFAPS